MYKEQNASVQGREKDVIIFSCVRSDPQKGIGFLADVRRMNVALTRAKYTLLVIGHDLALRTNSDWSALVDFAQARHAFVRVKDARQELPTLASALAFHDADKEEGEVIGEDEDEGKGKGERATRKRRLGSGSVTRSIPDTSGQQSSGVGRRPLKRRTTEADV
jgi:senataxin